MNEELHGLSTRAKNVLRCMGVSSKKELLELGPAMAMPGILFWEIGCGVGTVHEIQLWLGLPPMTPGQARRAKLEALDNYKELQRAETLLLANGWTVIRPPKG